MVKYRVYIIAILTVIKNVIGILTVVLITSLQVNGQQQTTTDSLLSQLENVTKAEEKFRIASSLSQLYLYNSPSKAIEYADQAYHFAQAASRPDYIADALYDIASGYWSLGNLSQSLATLTLADSISLANGFVRKQAKIKLRLGSLYSSVDDYFKAINYYQQAIDLAPDSVDQSIRGSLFNNIGKAYLSINEPELAIESLTQALRYVNDNTRRLLAIRYFNFADAYFQLKDYETASSYLEQCYEVATEYNDIRALIRIDQLTAEIALIDQKYELALEKAKAAYEAAIKSQVKELIQITALTYSHAVEKSGNKGLALDLMKLSSSYKDSIQNQIVLNELELVNFERNEKEKQQLLEQKEIAQLRAKNQRILVIAAEIVSALMILFAIFIIRRQRLVQKQNAHLQEKNKLIEEQREQLDYLSNFKTKMMAIMAHDVKGPIQSVYGIMDLLKDRLVSSQDVTQLLPHMQNQLTQVNLLLNNIFEWSRAELNEQIYQPEVIQINQLIAESIEENSAAEEAKKIKMVNEIPKTLTAYADPNMLRVVLRNLIFNAIKYSHEGGKVIFKAWTESSKCLISITDEGVGMNEQTMNRLFSHDTKSMLGTASEVGTGFGLIMCKDFMTMNQGSIEVSSEPNKGTTFTISLPTNP